MAYDYKKEQKQYYHPTQKPSIVEMPPMNYIAVFGKGDPNAENGDYKQSIELLYGIAFTIKMSYRNQHEIKGYFEYVVPPLEGLWWQEGNSIVDLKKKEQLQFISMIRLPDFVSEQDVEWAKSEATRKKQKDYAKVKIFSYVEGLCVQCMHIGSYDLESHTIEAMQAYAKEKGYQFDITETRLHHEIYLSDPRRVSPSKLKTVIRYPIK